VLVRVMGVRPLAALALLVSAISATGCVTNRFESVATEAAARDSCYSSKGITIERLESYAFRSDGCGGQKFYRCWYKRKTGGRVQCCARVDTEERARALFFDERYESEPFCTEA
jgi:hypothetical protein